MMAWRIGAAGLLFYIGAQIKDNGLPIGNINERYWYQNFRGTREYLGQEGVV